MRTELQKFLGLFVFLTPYIFFTYFIFGRDITEKNADLIYVISCVGSSVYYTIFTFFIITYSYYSLVSTSKDTSYKIWLKKVM